MNNFEPTHLKYVSEHKDILENIFELIQIAQDSIILQMYLFSKNEHMTTLKPLENDKSEAQIICDWLILKKSHDPKINIIVILDTHTSDSQQLKSKNNPTIRQQLKKAGIIVLNANLFHTKFNPNKKTPKISQFHNWNHNQINSHDWVRLQNKWQISHNVEDHRKNLIIDNGRYAFLTSHNFLDCAFDWYENAFVISGSAALQLWHDVKTALKLTLKIPQDITKNQKQIIESEIKKNYTFDLLQPISYSLKKTDSLNHIPKQFSNEIQEPIFYFTNARILKTLEIKTQILNHINRCQNHHKIQIASAYFSDKSICNALAKASNRGVKVFILVDNLKGLPLGFWLSFLLQHLVNRYFYEWARSHSKVKVRLHCSKNYKMMHLKSAVFYHNQPTLLAGQANYTPRSFNGSWLESNIETDSFEIINDFEKHFEKLWQLPQTKPLPSRNILNWIWGKFCLGLVKIANALGFEA